jgi:hypothetical protein
VFRFWATASAHSNDLQVMHIQRSHEHFAGRGTNVQPVRPVALHHLDAPWRSRDIEQCEGEPFSKFLWTPFAGLPMAPR